MPRGYTNAIAVAPIARLLVTLTVWGTRRSTQSQLPELRRQVFELAKRHKIEVVFAGGRSRAARASPSKGRPARIQIREVRSQVTYLIALHELGHLIAPGNRGKNQFEREAHAWRWAFDHSLVVPTPYTCKRIFDYLSSYYQAGGVARRARTSRRRTSARRRLRLLDASLRATRRRANRFPRPVNLLSEHRTCRIFPAGACSGAGSGDRLRRGDDDSRRLLG